MTHERFCIQLCTLAIGMTTQMATGLHTCNRLSLSVSVNGTMSTPASTSVICSDTCEGSNQVEQPPAR